MRRFVFTLLMTMIISLSLFVSGFAQAPDNNNNHLRIKYLSSIITSLSIKNGTAYANVTVRDADNTSTKIETTAYLQKKSGKSWNNVAIWQKSTTSNRLTLKKSKKISRGTYRLKSVTKAYKGKANETITDYSPERKY